MPAMTDQIREILSEHARMPVEPATLKDNDDLYDSGMTSHASVQVMLGLEEAFDVEFPDSMLTRSVFGSIASIASAIEQLGRAAAA
jgi:acyl carrier protein